MAGVWAFVASISWSTLVATLLSGGALLVAGHRLAQRRAGQQRVVTDLGARKAELAEQADRERDLCKAIVRDIDLLELACHQPRASVFDAASKVIAHGGAVELEMGAEARRIFREMVAALKRDMRAQTSSFRARLVKAVGNRSNQLHGVLEAPPRVHKLPFGPSPLLAPGVRRSS